MKLDKRFRPEKTTGNDESRYDLSACYLDLSNAAAPVLVSTDGWMMTVIPVVAEDGDTSGAIPSEGIRAARHLSNNGRITIRASSHVELPEPLEILSRPNIKFPDWGKVVPKAGSVTVNLDIFRLMAVAKALGADADRNTVVSLNFEPGETGTFALVVALPGEEARGYLMTARSK